MTNTVLVVASHPDDEILGCGGTLCKHVEKGDLVNILIVSEGSTSRLNYVFNDICSSVTALQNISSSVADKLGCNSFKFLSYPDNRLDSLDRLDLTQSIESHIQLVEPSIIYTHFSGDLNVDHRRVFESVLTACRPFPSSLIKTILSFEIPSSTDWAFGHLSRPFSPTWYSDITPYLQKKLDLLSCYDSEMRPWPHSRSIQALSHLAQLRGSQIGVHAAESFSVVRHVE